MNPDMLKERGITRIVGSGACLIRNQVLQREIQEMYQTPVEFVEEGNACIGAAMAVADRWDSYYLGVTCELSLLSSSLVDNIILAYTWD